MLSSPKNGIYINLVRNARDAFEESPLVKINCQGLHASDYKKIGAKLKELVPCVLLSFDQEQILMWRGRDWKSKYSKSASLVPNNRSFISGTPYLGCPGQTGMGDARSTDKNEISSPRMFSLWKRALEASKALLLDETVLSPDTLLEKVEEFEGTTQAVEHSYPALISSGVAGADILLGAEEEPKVKTKDDRGEDLVNMNDHYSDDTSDAFGFQESLTPFGSLPVDSLAKHLNPE
uniref:CRS2-associated factor 2, chloroplastic n=1 Tax=Anthurium amnicola TaxID=1678845 RepID=A0A1D1XMH9_9ARAE